MTRYGREVADAQGTTHRRGRAKESAPRQRRASAVGGRGVLGRWGLGPDGEVRAVWRRCPVPLFPGSSRRATTNAPEGRAVAPTTKFLW